MSNSLEDSRFTLYYVTNELGLKILDWRKIKKKKISGRRFEDIKMSQRSIFIFRRDFRIFDNKESIKKTRTLSTRLNCVQPIYLKKSTNVAENLFKF